MDLDSDFTERQHENKYHFETTKILVMNGFWMKNKECYIEYIGSLASPTSSRVRIGSCALLTGVASEAVE
jgi:hypothetical protein